MDAPSSEDVLGWYKYGPFPGSKGSAALAGHTGRPDQPAPFRKLERLKKDDIITVKDVHGSVFDFKVTEIASYPTKQAPQQRIFGDTTLAQLVIITCSGNWREEEKSYSDRLVVYSVRTNSEAQKK